jgi:hypothetical protein
MDWLGQGSQGAAAFWQEKLLISRIHNGDG